MFEDIITEKPDSPCCPYVRVHRKRFCHMFEPTNSKLDHLKDECKHYDYLFLGVCKLKGEQYK